MNITRYFHIRYLQIEFINVLDKITLMYVFVYARRVRPEVGLLVCIHLPLKCITLYNIK